MYISTSIIVFLQLNPIMNPIMEIFLQKYSLLQLIIKLIIIRPRIEMNKTHNYILVSIKNSKKIINADGSKYPVVKQVAIEQGYQLGSDFYTLYWTDGALTIKQIRQLPLYVKVNHLPEITTLTRKNKMASSLNCMLRYFPKEYDFYPETYLLPMDYSMLQKKQQKDKYYIVKPENGCQGKGIFLTNSISKIQKSSQFIVQKYISNPLLIDSLKFDMRIYVLITCVQPLRVFMYKDGLARFATQPFQQPNEENFNDLFKHLTNYAINKNHQQFTVDNQDYGKGHKRLLSSLFSPQMLKAVHKSIADIVIKSIISVLPALQNAMNLCKKQSNLNSCFQLLGFDIIMTQNGKFKLLQINQNPSLMTQTAVDVSLKKQLLRTIFNMIESPTQNIQDRNQSKIKTKDKKQLEKAGNFTRIYPCTSIQQTQQYDRFITKSQELFRQKFGLGVLRQQKREATSKDNVSNNTTQWNQSSQFYSKQKLAKVYGSGARNTMKTAQKKRLMFY